MKHPTCACGERLLLIRPGRDQCERCRLGKPTERVWLYGLQAGLWVVAEQQREEQYRAEVAARLAQRMRRTA